MDMTTENPLEGVVAKIKQREVQAQQKRIDLTEHYPGAFKSIVAVPLSGGRWLIDIEELSGVHVTRFVTVPLLRPYGDSLGRSVVKLLCDLGFIPVKMLSLN